MKYSYLSIQEKMKRIYSCIERLKSSVVIVEGKKDKEALLKLGVNSITLNTALSNVLNINGDVIVLTDLDGDGNRIASFLEYYLSQPELNCSIKSIDTQFRRKFLSLLNIKHVENAFNAYKKEVELWQKHI